MEVGNIPPAHSDTSRRRETEKSCPNLCNHEKKLDMEVCLKVESREVMGNRYGNAGG